MNGPHDSKELSATDRLVMASLSAPLEPTTEARLRSTLNRLREQLRNPKVVASVTPDRTGITLWVALSLCLLLGAVVAVVGWPRDPGRAAINQSTKNEPLPTSVPATTPPVPESERLKPSTGGESSPTDSDSSIAPADSTLTTLEKDDEGYGTLTGQFVLIGTAPVLPPLVKARAPIKSLPAKGNPDIPDESLLVDHTTNGIENIVLYLPKAPTTVHPKLAARKLSPVTFDATGGRFVPHVLFAQANQVVLCRSLDPLSHNVHTLPLKNRQENFLVGPTATPIAVTPTVAERMPFKVVDDIYPWMSAYWLILDHPYAAITAKDGRFAIRQLPAGTHEFKVWHERAGYVNKSLQVTIASQQQTDLGVIHVAMTQLLR